jgi:NADPH2:quinone reductase
MKAVVATALGGPEVLQLQSVTLNWPRGAKDVLVRLKAAALNPADVWFRSLGAYLKPAGPLILGHDGAGIVEAVGNGVSRVKPGDRVCFCNGGIGGEPGTYAEFAVTPEAQLAVLPPDISFESAAALPLVFITAWEALRERAQVAAGEHVLIQGGAGGTGHMAVQIAKLRGAHVAATVSGAEKARFVEAMGADKAVNYRSEDFAEAALAWTGGQGLDVALDNVGAEAMQKTFRAMAPYGRIVTLMGTPADDAETNAYNKNLTLHNLMMLTPMWLGLRDRLEAQARIVAEGVALLAAGKLNVHVNKVYPLAEAAAAHRQLEAGGSIGKIVLRIGD